MEVFQNKEDFLIVYKENGVPSSVGKTAGSACEQVFAKFPEIKTVKGKNKDDGGLVHRIDTETSGLLLFAKNQQFYDKITEAQNCGNFIKYYTAYCIAENFDFTVCENLPKMVTSYFRPFGKKGAMVKPVFMGENLSKSDAKKSGNKLYTTKILSIKPFLEHSGTNIVKVECEINSGFRHQVRSHLNSQNLPVFGDKLYSKNHKESAKMLFFASGLLFFGEKYSLSSEELDNIAKSELFLR